MAFSRLPRSGNKTFLRRDFLLAVVSGLLLAISFPKPGISVCAWFAFVPLFMAVGNPSASMCCLLVVLLIWATIHPVRSGSNWAIAISLFGVETLYGLYLYLAIGTSDLWIAAWFGFMMILVSVFWCRLWYLANRGPIALVPCPAATASAA